MGTHVNFAVIIPDSDDTYSVAIARGVAGTGDPRTVVFDEIANRLPLELAGTIARAAPHVFALDFKAYEGEQSNG